MLEPMKLAEATEREKFRRDRWSTMSVEEKIEALNVRVEDEVDRLSNHTLPEIDEQINRAIKNSYEVGNQAREAYNASVREIRTTKDAFEQSIQRTLNATVNDLIRRSDSSVVAEALHQALRTTILKVRPATREEARSKDTLVVRTASPAEIREQQ